MPPRDPKPRHTTEPFSSSPVNTLHGALPRPRQSHLEGAAKRSPRAPQHRPRLRPSSMGQLPGVIPEAPPDRENTRILIRTMASDLATEPGPDPISSRTSSSGGMDGAPPPKPSHVDAPSNTSTRRKLVHVALVLALAVVGMVAVRSTAVPRPPRPRPTPDVDSTSVRASAEPSPANDPDPLLDVVALDASPTARHSFQLLVDALRQLDSDPGLAFQKAAQSHHQDPSDDALRVMTRAACRLGEATAAQSTLDRLPPLARLELQAECTRFDVQLNP